MMIAIKLRLDQIDNSKIRQSDGCDDDDFCDADNDDVGIDAGIDTAPSRRPPCDMASAYLSERALLRRGVSAGEISSGGLTNSGCSSRSMSIWHDIRKSQNHLLGRAGQRQHRLSP